MKSKITINLDAGIGYATLILHSIAIGSHIEIATFEIYYNRFIHSEFMTHRVFGRNASSSRAIPILKMLQQVWSNPAEPLHWGRNQAGMQADNQLTGVRLWLARKLWRTAAKTAAALSYLMWKLDMHKQIGNRITEPFQYIRVVVTATEWENFFALRVHKAAQPEIHDLAKAMKQCLKVSTPQKLSIGGWHIPYVDDMADSHSIDYKLKVSTGRTAKVSYNNHGTGTDMNKDAELHDMLVTRPYKGKGLVLDKDEPIHASPTEHCAKAMHKDKHLPSDGNFEDNPWEKGVTHIDYQGRFWSGNLRGFVQYRQTL